MSDDEIDKLHLAIHYDIERAISVISWARKLTRAQSLQTVLDACHSMKGPGVTAVETITLSRSISKDELASRVVAFMEADEEEEIERARAAVLREALREDAAP